ncbi:hypothetical protein [Microbacterium testaceum]|uniref:hypothetical protein n=1 Tax=Microbacterium enclense TaxID=993073 RepID=UPI0012B7A2AD|nr:hypothetical protein [Microbacterium testaceum]
MRSYKKVLIEIARRLYGDHSALAAQAIAAIQLNESTTILDLRVPDSVPRVSAPDGPLDIRTFVVDRSGEYVGEIIVWITDGFVSCLEQAWYIGDAPRSWPNTKRLVAE